MELQASRFTKLTTGFCGRFGESVPVERLCWRIPRWRSPPWFLPLVWCVGCRGAHDIITQISRSHTNTYIYLGHTHQFPYLPLVGPTHILTHNTGLMVSWPQQITSYWGGIQNEIYNNMRETSRAWFRLNSSSAFLAHSKGPPQWLIPDTWPSTSVHRGGGKPRRGGKV